MVWGPEYGMRIRVAYRFPTGHDLLHDLVCAQCQPLQGDRPRIAINAGFASLNGSKLKGLGGRSCVLD